MPLYSVLLIFAASLATVPGGSVLLSRGLREIGESLRLPEQFLGFVIALGADSPEIASSLVAMTSGQQDVGAGVIFGSNLFNLASLLGLGALVAGGIKVQRGTVLVNGGVGLLVTVLALLLASGWGPGTALPILILIVPIPYAATLWIRRASIHSLPLPESWATFLSEATSDRTQGSGEGNALSEGDEEDQEDKAGRQELSWKSVLTAAVALVLIVAGSIALVRLCVQTGCAFAFPRKKMALPKSNSIHAHASRGS